MKNDFYYASVMLTSGQIEKLNTTAQASFYHEQTERFEVLEYSSRMSGQSSLVNAATQFGNSTLCLESDEQRHMRWYENQLEALFAFNYFGQKHDVALLYDLAEDGGFCLLIDTPLLMTSEYERLFINRKKIKGG